MTTCERCGRESPDEFGFCPGCGATLAVVPAAREVRKVVTVLFCDLAGSTALGERTDPEALRALMNRYYDTARAALERHGGTVEKFVGDAVMAVFGIPVASEDDALRAVRAAVELRDVVHDLDLEARIGVNTGEVVAGEGGTLVTGDAVNVAARLEQAAPAGEILLGDTTFHLVRDAIEDEPVELAVKGKALPLAAHRLTLLDASAAGVARHLDRPMVGRARERQRIRADFADVVAAGTCRLFTLIGSAGVGKSRLVGDFLEHAADGATVARGRALSYGEGITYWPLVEILLQLGLDPDEAIRSSPADTQLATRALLEHVAQRRPLVLVVDDLQWAEEPLLDLVEHVVDWSRDAPMFLLCVARPELLDVRPGWGGGKLNATSILLEPLSTEEAAQLADTLFDGTSVDADTRARVLATAEGNPLFIEEMSALVHEVGGAVEVPPTIQAVLQARLDRLSEAERVVIERGAVEGKVFHRGSVTALAPEPQREAVPGHLFSLVRKELVRPDRTQIAGDDAFRFRHLLIRDTAYEALPKAVRAELHERFADWLAEHGGLLELDEIVGYHLEQAARYRLEFDPADARAVELGGRAAKRLGDAGHAAFEREDHHATRNLLGRAVALVPPGADRRRLIPDLVDASLLGGDATGLGDLLDELVEGDERERATADVLRAHAELTSGGGREFRELEAVVRAARAALEATGDEMAVIRAERVLAQLAWALGQAGESHRYARSVHERLRRLGSTAYESEIVGALQMSAVFGGASLEEVRQELRDLYDEAEEAGPLLAASLGAAQARIDYQQRVIDADEVTTAVSRYVELLRQTGSTLEAAVMGNFLHIVRWLEGDDVAAEAGHREHVADLEELGDRAYLANAMGTWATSLCLLGDTAAALTAVESGRSLARADDVADQIALDMAAAHARALQGEREQAKELLARATALVKQVDMARFAEIVEYIEAHVLHALGDEEGARTRLERLCAAAQEGGRPRFADRYRRDLAELGG